MTNPNSPEELKGTAALAQFLRNKQRSKQGLGPVRRYVLERVDGELVFRQPEIDAILEDAIDELSGVQPTGRCIIKLP